MTPEQEALVEALRLFAADQGIGFDRMHNQMAAGLIEPIGEDLCDSTFSVTPAGRLVLALAAERDELRTALEREKRLHSLLLELTRLDTEVSLWGSDFDNAKEQGAGDEELERLIDKISKAVDAANAARAAYVAAGGVVLWLTNRFRCFCGARPVASGTSTWASLKPRCTTPMRANTAAWCGGRPLFRPAGFSFYLGSRTREVWCERI